MKYQIKLISKARKDLDSIKGKEFDVIAKKILILPNNPRPIGCRKLTNEDGHRIRIGKFRVLYRIDDPSKTIFIYRIKYRKDAYR